MGDSHGAQLFPALAKSQPDTNVVFANTLGTPLLEGGDADNTWVRNFIKSNPSISHVLITSFWGLRGVAQSQLVDTVDFVQKSGADAIVIDDSPTFVFDADACKFNRSLVLPRECSQGLEVGRSAAASVSSKLESVANQSSAIRIPIADYFCSDQDCSMARGGTILYRDIHHLNFEGSEYLISALVRDYPQVFNFS